MDIYREVTEKLLTSIENGLLPWRKPWKDLGGTWPTNFATKSQYNGINVLILWVECEVKGYERNQWMTYKQASAVKGQVRKGEKGTRVVFWKTLNVTDDTTGKDRSIPLATSFIVFNVAQIDGLHIDNEPQKQTWDDFQKAEELMHMAQVIYRGDSAFYSPGTDTIVLPKKTQFNSDSEYYSTALHELLHWTGAEKRLNRLVKTPFGSELYATEELVAEIGSAFLCSMLGITNNTEPHAQYMMKWYKDLKEDPKLLFRTASAAQKACNFLLKKAEVIEGIQEAA